MDLKQKLAGGLIKPVLRKLGKGDNLFDRSNGPDQYRGDVVAEVNDTTDSVNVLVICALKRSDHTISTRQEVRRGLRSSVNQHGDRTDHPATVHDVNVLTVVASESAKDFVSALQMDIGESLSVRPRLANEEFFSGKVLQTAAPHAAGPVC